MDLDPEELKRDLSFSQADIDTAMYEQASLSAHYGVLAAQAQQAVSRSKVRLKTIVARVSKEMRANYAIKGTKITENQLNNEVAADSRVAAVEMEVVNAQYDADMARSAFEAFKQRRDMLVQISKTRLEEYRGELRTVVTDNVNDLKQRALDIAKGDK